MNTEIAFENEKIKFICIFNMNGDKIRIENRKIWYNIKKKNERNITVNVFEGVKNKLCSVEKK